MVASLLHHTVVFFHPSRQTARRGANVERMGALDNSTSTAPEGATAGGTIAGVFVTLLAAAILAYSMVVQRHASVENKPGVASRRRPPGRVAAAAGRSFGQPEACSGSESEPAVAEDRALVCPCRHQAPNTLTLTRHALAHADTSGSKRVPLLPRLECCRVPRLVGWLMGLLLYGVASGLKIVGFNLGPFTVLASVFTTLLVFNLAFAHWLLGETITRDKVISSCLVLLGAVISTAGTPSGVP